MLLIEHRNIVVFSSFGHFANDLNQVAPVRYHACDSRDNIRAMPKRLIIWAAIALAIVVALGIFFPKPMHNYESIAVWLEGS